MPTTRKLMIAAYGLIAVAALFATWSQNLSYFAGGAAGAMSGFWSDTTVNAAARSITVDIGFFLLAGVLFMAAEARRLRIRWVWAYVVLGFLVAISVTFSLFMIARELRLQAAGEAPARLTATDFIGLAATTAATLGLVAFVLR